MSYANSGFNVFSICWGSGPVTGSSAGPLAVVDPLSPLWIPGLIPCGAGETCINDNSSTGFVPTGLQANGQSLTPVAYHGTTSTAFDNAAVSSTMGSRTFNTCGNPGQPLCDPNDVPAPGDAAVGDCSFAGHGTGSTQPGMMPASAKHSAPASQAKLVACPTVMTIETSQVMKVMTVFPLFPGLSPLCGE
jgi:hypothetical protein